MKFLIIPTFLFVLTRISGDALNILAIFPYEGKSHFFVADVYLRELAKRGHNVTVISHFPRKDPVPNYHDISLVGSSDIVVEGSLPAEQSYAMILMVLKYLAVVGVQDCEVMLANKNVRNLIYNNEKFDLVVIEEFTTDCGLGLAYKLKAPVVAITTHVPMPFHHQRRGMPSNPSYVPFHFLGGGTKPNLLQRLERNVFKSIFNSVFYVVQKLNERTLAKYFDGIPPLEDLARDIKFLLMYTNFALTGSRLLPSNVIEVGGYHVTKAKPLIGDLKKFVEESEHGVILVSFGSVVTSDGFPYERAEILIEAMKEFPQRFIWKWGNNTLAIKDKLFIMNWLPQIDILGHAKTQAFVSHAGMGSTTEAIYYGVPMLAIPFVGDQPCNAALIDESGFGVHFSINNLTKDNFVQALKKILDPQFRENAKKVSAAWHDRPMSPLDTAIYWTEYAAKHSNTIKFRSAAADVPFYQYMYLDIAFCLIIVTALTYYILTFILSKCFSKKLNNDKNTKDKSKITKTKKPKRE